MIETRFTQLVGCSVPIQSAAIGGLATHILAPAVADAGGLGMVSVSGLAPEHIAAMLDRVREQTSGVFGAGMLIPFLDPAIAQESIAAAAARADVVEFFYGDPDSSFVEIIHAAGSLACWQVGSREEAIAAADANCDFIIAQGTQAGGHVRGKMSMLTLLIEVLEAVDVPVLAAGGIGSGRAMAAALAAGADGVRLGTRFVGSVEAEAHPDYVQALIAARAKDTVITETFSVGWPDAPHRVLRQSVEAVESFDGEIVGERPDWATGEPRPIPRFAISTPGQDVTGSIEALPHYAGESVDAVEKMQPAAEIVRELADECEKLLQRWN